MGRLLDIAQAVPVTNTRQESKQESLREKREKVSLLEMNAELERLHGYIIRLRCEDPPRGSRDQALTYQQKQMERLAALSIAAGGTEDGWPDPADPFADGDQLTGLRAALAELEAGPYPVPLPEGCTLLPQANFDPFEHARLYNGMVSTSPCLSPACLR